MRALTILDGDVRTNVARQKQKQGVGLAREMHAEIQVDYGTTIMDSMYWDPYRKGDGVPLTGRVEI